MNYPYYEELHSWSKHYHEEALQEEARVGHLAHRAKAPRRPRSQEQGRWSWLGKLAATLSGSLTRFCCKGAGAMPKTSTSMQRRWFFGFLIAASLLVGACAPGEPPSEQVGGPTSGSSGPVAVSTLDGAKQATVYIEARGGISDVGRALGEISYGSGSGFIIDPSGLAVTNNHVVTGAGYVQVYVEGEEEPLDAEVLGVSECSDLALIDIEGGSYPFLDWREEEIDSGLDVTAIGYPAQDVGAERPDQEVSQGIINSTGAPGETRWASVKSVLEHQARLDPGSSGGPLVDDNGRVVGINFAGSGDQQYFAISRDEAQTIIDDLRMGNIDSIGVNGEAYREGQFAGIVVASVETGSPAADAGVEGITINEGTGNLEQLDVITELEGTKLGENKTKKELCNVLRGHSPEDPLSMEVLRGSFDEAGNLTEIVTLRGVLNGQPLEEVEPPAVVDQYESDTAPASGYTTVTDDSGAITMEAPVAWSEVDGTPRAVFEGGENVPTVVASPDIDGFLDAYAVPGALIGASSSLVQEYTPDTLLDEQYDFSGDCEHDGRQDYDDGLYTGRLEDWKNCDGVEGQRLTVVAALPEDQSFMVVAVLQYSREADLDAAVRVLDTFEVVGEV
jgi:serine protease Do